ncbi:MAG TPA: hypothetical protein VFR28_08155 [Allosphingosinicella sp.]|jgi:hypothetical protein|nr:hypothetical protein [Allosphingosinicella sp.]
MKNASFVAAFALLAAAPALADTPSGATNPAKDPDKVVCKRTVDTGSLVRGTRVCKTRREWDRAGQSARKQAHDMQTQGQLNTRAPQ